MISEEFVLGDLSRIKWSHMACVLAGVLIATLARFPFQAVMRDASPFLFYIPVVVAVAVIYGKRYGLYATILSVLPANYFWMAPKNTFAMDLNELFQILGFSFAGFSVSWVSHEVCKHSHLEKHLRAALASMGDAVVTTDCRGRIVYLNPAAQVLIEKNDQELTGCMVGVALDLMAVSGEHPLEGTFQAAICNDEMDHLPQQVILISRTGEQHLVQQNASRLLDANGEKIGAVIIFRRLQTKGEACPIPMPPKSPE